MNKNSKKGFVLMETLIVSTLILATLVFLYLEFKSVRNKYEYSFKYNTVPGIYMAGEISNFLVENGYDNLKNMLVDDVSYIDITSSSTVNGDSSVYNSLITDMKINRIIFTKDKISFLKNHLNSDDYDKSIFNETFIEYISKLYTNNTDSYRIIIQFDNSTYSTIIVGEDPNITKLTKIDAQPKQTHKGIVYLDPTNLANICDVSNSHIGSGTTGCMKFYIYDDSGDTYKMILDHNTENGVVWNSSSSNVAYESSGAYTSINNLGWDSSLNTTLITTTEINKIIGKTGFDSTNRDSYYYFDSKNHNQTITKKGDSKYAWLFDYTNDCESRGCDIASSGEGDYGYWTKDTVGSAESGEYSWIIFRDGRLNNTGVNSTEQGVRPVITIAKVLFD